VKVTIRKEPLQIGFHYSDKTVKLRRPAVFMVEPESLNAEPMAIVRNTTVEVPVRAVACYIRPFVENPAEAVRTPALASAEAVCSPEDSFSKVAGRKLALRRAMDASQNGGFKLTKTQRRAVWDKFLTTCRFTATRGPLTQRELKAIRARERNRRKALVEARLAA
jgi:hypothetical protein